MIKFKQKEYVAPLAALAAPAIGNAIGIGGLAMQGAGMVQGGIQSKKNLEAQEKIQQMQSRDQKRLAKAEMAKAAAMNNLATAARTNPQTAASFGNASASIMQNTQKSFSGPNFRSKVGKVFRDGQQLIRDSFEVGNQNGRINKTVARGIVGGLTSAGLAYGVNKILAHDARKNGLMEERTEEEKVEAKAKRKKTLKKLGIGTASVLGAAGLATLGAKKGVFGNNAQQWSNNHLTLKNIGKHAGMMGKELAHGAVNQFDTRVKDANGNFVMKENGKHQRSYIGPALTLGFGVGMPLASYAIMKSKIKKQQALAEQQSQDQEDQKEYSYRSFKFKRGIINTLDSTKKGVTAFFKKPVQNSLEVANRFKGGTGVAGVDDFSTRLAQRGEKSLNNGGSYVTIKAANFIKNHKNLALLGGIGVAGALMKPWSWGNKLGRKALKTADTDAYAYDEAGNQQVEE